MAISPEQRQYNHDYYLRNKDTKNKGSSIKQIPGPTPSKKSQPVPKNKSTPTVISPKQTPAALAKSAQARIGRLKSKISKLEGALSQAEAALSKKRQTSRETEKDNSDGKSTTSEKNASKDYREKHKEEIKSKEKKDSPSSSSTSSSSSSSSTSVESMGVDDLEARVSSIKNTLSSAKAQLSTAQKQLGQLAHSMIVEHTTFNEGFVRPPISRKDSVNMKADFSGWATRNNLRCSDGRTILADAFKDNDKMIVPLFWQHGHHDNENVLGHVMLENKPEGVRAHAFFNKTPKGLSAKEQVAHGDIKWLSIFANNLVEQAKQVIKGNIREVSLVLAGANPGASIDNQVIAHGADSYTVLDDEAKITTGLEIETSTSFEVETQMAHAETAAVEKTRTPQEILDDLDEESQAAVYYLLSQALTVGGQAQHSDESTEGTETSTESEGTETSTESEGTETETSTESEGTESSEDGAAAESEGEESSESTESGDAVVQHANNQEDKGMTINVFDQANAGQATTTGGTLQHAYFAESKEPVGTLSHDDVKGIMKAVVDNNSRLSTEMNNYALAHGIENIEYLFPDAKTLTNSPAFVSRRMEWVDKVLGSVRKAPFARIRTITADITADEARARGYITGNMKNEEFFALSKRETTPQTIYKKQKLDRDDVIDIADIDVIAWLKAEMKLMLDEEIAGAILIGDGRSMGDEDKIKETNIRPIASDEELYVTTAFANLDDASSSIEELVDLVITNRQYYKGSGTPTFYTSEAVIAKFLTVKDGFGRRLYNSLAEVAQVLRCSDIVAVDVLGRVPDVVGIMVNLTDYTIGTDRGGQATMFDDFDLDYNKLRYLLETRISGALTMPKSAIVFRKVAGSAVLVSPDAPAFNESTGVLTVPTKTGVVYKNAAGTTLTTGAPVTVNTANSPYLVKATPTSGYFFTNDQSDEWTYNHEA